MQQNGWSPVVGAVAIAILGGCHSPFDQHLYGDPIGLPATARSPTDPLASHSASPSRPQSAGTEGLEIPEGAGPDVYVRLALARNPGLKAAQRRVARLTQRIAQVTSLADPMFRVDPIGEMAETAAGEVVLMTSVSQKLPFPGKLAASGRIAAQDVAMAIQDLEGVRLAVAADTRRAFWSYYFTARGIEVIEADRKLLAQFRQIAESKYKAGTATQQDVLRASVELSNLDNELITLRQRQTTAIAMLNNLLDRPVDAPVPEPKRVALNDISLRLDRLLDEAATVNPALEKVRQRIEAFRQRLELARLQRWPDLTVSLDYNVVSHDGLAPMATGDDQWWLGFGINLPIWTKKLDAAEREARQGIFEGVADLTNQRNQVAFRVQDALVKVETQQRLVLMFRDVIIPLATQTVEVSESGYRTGKEDFLTLFENWRKLLDFELMYHQSLSQLEQNFAELQQVVGRDLARQSGSVPDEAEHHVPDIGNSQVPHEADEESEP